MDTEIQVKGGEITKAIGMLWRIEKLAPNQLSTKELHRMLRREVLGRSFISGSKLDAKGNMPHTFTMPCGDSVTYPDVDDIPMVNIPCSCGNPGHWFVKYEEVNNVAT